MGLEDAMEEEMATHSSILVWKIPWIEDPHGLQYMGSFVHGIFQARMLEWVSFPSPGDPPNPGIEPTTLISLVVASRFFTNAPPGKPTESLILKH